MRNLNKTLRTAKIDEKPWKEAIFDFLLHYRITPHSTTLISPTETLYNRKINCKIPTYEEVKDTRQVIQGKN